MRCQPNLNLGLNSTITLGRMRTFWATVPAIAFAVVAGIATAYPAGFDGTWQANGQGVGRCGGSYFVRLTVAQGQASGTLTIPGGIQNLENLVLRPDGTFSATAAPATESQSRRLLQGGQVSGKLSGDTITVTFQSGNPICGTRKAKGTRVSQ